MCSCLEVVKLHMVVFLFAKKQAISPNKTCMNFNEFVKEQGSVCGILTKYSKP